MKLSHLKIDPEFQSKIPPLQFEEEQQLEQNIITEGRLLNPIIVWNGYILDGHTRYRILKRHSFIKYEVEEIQLANRYEALAWICKNQLGRRNLSPERKKFLLGKEYESTKLAVGGQPGNCNPVKRCAQNEHIVSEKRTCERIAKEHGVGHATVQRAEKYAKGIDAAEEAVPGAQEEILTGRIKATDAQIAALPAIPKEERPAILEELRKEKSKRDENRLSRLKPERPPPKPALPEPEPPQNEESAAPEPVMTSPPEEEIEPASNGPPSFLQKIQGHKRHLSEEDMVRLKASVESRYRDRIAESGSIMLCELQGAAEDFMFRWGIVFQNYPDVLSNETGRKAISALIDRMMTYLNTVPPAQQPSLALACAGCFLHKKKEVDFYVTEQLEISQRGYLLCRHGAAYRLGTGRQASRGGSAKQHWKPSFAYIDRSNRDDPDGKEEKPAHPCAGGFQPGF